MTDTIKSQLNRLKGDNVQTIGRATLLDDNFKSLFGFLTLELGWLNNQRNISCIPDGEYDVIVRYSKKHGRHLHVTNVKNRTFILIHFGNFNRDTAGCILAGKEFVRIDNDEYLDISNSVNTFVRLMNNISDEDKIKLVITPTIYTI